MHVVGVSSLAAGHLTLVPALRDALAELGRDGHHDRRRRRHPAAGLRRRCSETGAAAVFPPGTVIAEAAQRPARRSCRARPRPRLRPHAPIDVDALRRRACSPATARVHRRGRSRWSSRTGADHRRAGAGAAASSCCRTPAGARRVGISGVPGVGKSTFIDALGIDAHRRRAPGRGAGRRPVVDAAPAARSSATRPGWRGWPSTRARVHPARRPPPGTLGGVAQATRESMRA